MFVNVTCVDDFIKAASPSDDDLETFCYIFYEISKGYYFFVKNNVVNVVCFFNPDFKNSWGNSVKIKNNLEKEHEVKKFIYNSELFYKFANSRGSARKWGFQKFKKHNAQNLNYENYELCVDRWYANNGLCRYDKRQKNGLDGPLSVYNYVVEICKKRNMPDCSFFLNARDSPIDAKGNLEPYFHIFGVCERPREKPKICSKVFSFCTNENLYNDIAIPSLDDWKQITLEKDPPSIPWNRRIDKIVFRGSSTGFSVKTNVNPRLSILNYKHDCRLDVGITQWQTRPRFNKGFFEFIDEELIINNPCVKYLEPEKQARYKFLINIPGNCFAYRLSREFRSGCCVFLVDSAWKMWYSHLIMPFVHYIPVLENLSDLTEKIDWAFSNFDECEKIANNGLAFYRETFSKENVYDYVACCLLN